MNKVVSKNGGSALLKDCPLLESVASEIVKAVPIPVTAKIRTGWDSKSVNAIQTGQILQDCGIQALTIHGRTRAQGYSGVADWDVIGEVAENLSIPVIGNGDVSTGMDVEIRRAQTKVSGIMIGRAAMTNPWVFSEARHYLSTGVQPTPVAVEKRFELMRRHCQMAVERRHKGGEFEVMRSMRTRLMHYTRSIPGGKHIRTRFAHIGSLAELDDIAAEYLARLELQAA